MAGDSELQLRLFEDPNFFKSTPEVKHDIAGMLGVCEPLSPEGLMELLVSEGFNPLTAGVAMAEMLAETSVWGPPAAGRLVLRQGLLEHEPPNWPPFESAFYISMAD